MTGISILTQLEYLLRVCVAAICGGLLGVERERRVKSAGLKTHIIVAIGAALMMLVSKYGFFDLLRDAAFGENIKLDPSRVAASIVTAVGFLGAGVIFIKNFKVSGVTTAAGIWATVGIGMALGSGMYLIGGVVTAMIFSIQCLFHHNFKMFRRSSYKHLDLLLQGPYEKLTGFSRQLREQDILVNHIKMTRVVDSTDFYLELGISVPNVKDVERLTHAFAEEECLISINF